MKAHRKAVAFARIPTWLASAMLALGTLAFATACEDQGPAEETGEAIDDTAEDVRDEFND